MQETPIGSLMKSIARPGGGASLIEQLEAEIHADLERHAAVIEKAALCALEAEAQSRDRKSVV